MLVHDIIKIQYNRAGYLSNWPPHLISDVEMVNAFMPEDYSVENTAGVSYFQDNYPLITAELTDVYTQLVTGIQYHLTKLRNAYPDPYILPDWVYSYMLGAVISVNSDKLDIHDLLVLLGVDNIDDIFTAGAALGCYDISKIWLQKLNDSELSHRPPTCFGEPHVIKSLRLSHITV